ncbi:AraC family transcriptional regulator [Phaeobacter inhibens]|uniref:AraC family transcriptional regulator n=1 Tax=Phaeobacter inhibens TaxID=221822 RepID=UPI00295E647E|nr:AraC family transcriptional regulator ligand-binding domain-containing protein [Phaeobacter inhibens]
MTHHDPDTLATVSLPFIEDWLSALQASCDLDQIHRILTHSGLSQLANSKPAANRATQRVTLDQIVELYQIAAAETGDEMPGLWSRPVRPRALQHLLTTVREAGNLPAALYRFSTFWNLILDDYHIELKSEESCISLSLVPRGTQEAHRFGHMLLLKLAHGLLSWLAGYEVPVRAVQFAFDQPGFAQDYGVIFPAPVRFSQLCSAISFDPQQLGPPQPRSPAELAAFLDRAPRDWIFTGFREHRLSLQIRDFLYRSNWEDCRLGDAAAMLNVTPRTLMRRLEDEAASFQSIKDALRRDIAIRDLRAGHKSIEDISHDLGFSSSANFHRAFRRWTGGTTSSYR